MFAYTKLMQAMAAAGVVSATDPYFNLTTLLLPGNGTNGAQNNTFLDSSTNNFTITRNGNTTQGTFSPFSQTGWSNYFNSANSDYLSIADNSAFELGSGDFTIEGWVYLNALPASGSRYAIISKWSGLTISWIAQIFNNSGTMQLSFSYSTNGTGATSIDANASITANAWHHVAFVRSGSSFKSFLNGTEVTSSATISGTLFDGSSAVNIGRHGDGLNYFNGYISNCRLTKGGALYTTAFTPSTTPLTTTVSAGTVSLLTCQSNRFIDNSSNAFAITVNGTPSVQAFSPFAPTAAYSASTNGGSGYFDGAGDYLTAGTTSNFNFLHNSSALFTIEGWVYASSFASSVELFGTNSGTSNEVGTVFSINSSSQLRLLIGRGVSASPVIDATSTGTVSLNQWVHVAVTYDQSLASSNCIFYINGVSSGTVNKTANAPSSSSSAYPGTINAFGTSSGGACYLSGIRVNNSIVYTSAFTPPTAPPTAITNTQLLLNFTNAGITDATAKNDLETVGNAQISTTQSKFGGSSMYFDGTGDRLTTRFVPPQDLSGGNWTIEFWMNLGASVPTTFRSIAGASNGGGSVPKWILILNANTSYTYQANRLMFATYNGADRQLNIGFTWATNTWYHIAIVCSSGTTSIYIDGVSQGSMAYNIGSGITNGIVIGADGETYSEFTGYIDDFRVTKGYARYTANFTPPTAAFALQ